MITAHLPSGYVLAKLTRAPRQLMPFALLGAILPDFDMFWFHLVDNRAFHHHKYWVHAPGFWPPVALITLAILYRVIRPRVNFPVMQAACLFFGAIFMHVVLDTFTGSIMWLWPLNDTLYEVVTVPARYDNWVWSFILHWTFGAELMIWAAAIYLYFKPLPESSLDAI